MGRIFCIMGKSGSGKDSIFRYLMKDKSLGLRAYVPYTTRPKRQGEKDGVEYHFIGRAALGRLQGEGKVIELRRYDTVKGEWFYCTVDDGSFEESGNILMITTLPAYNSLKKRFGADAVFPVYIEVEDGLRLSRALSRERKQKHPDYSEMCRRYLADRSDFSEENIRKSGIGKRYENIRFKNCAEGVKKDLFSMIEKETNG